MVILTLLSAALVAAGTPGASSPLRSDPIAHLQAWEYRWDEGDAWKPATVGVSPKDRAGRTSAWYRVALPSGRWEAPRIFLSGVDGAFEAYIGGRRVYAWGSPAAAAGWPWHLLEVPRDVGDGFLYLHVHSVQPTYIGPYGVTSIGNFRDHVLDILQRDLLAVVIGLMAAALALAALLVFAVRRDQWAYLWFSVHALAQALMLISFSETKQLILDDPTLWQALLRLGRLVAPAALLAFVIDVLPVRRSRLALWTPPVLIFTGLALMAAQWLAWPALRGLLTQWANALFFCCALAGIALAARHLRRRGAPALLVGISALLGLGTHDALINLGIITGRLVYPWAVLGLLVLTGAVLLGRFMDVFAQLQRRTVELEARNAQLAVVEQELQHAVRARDEFLSIASHELRNPLATLSANAWLLAKQELPAADARRADSIVRQSKFLSQLVNEMLDAARVARGTLALNPSPVRLCEALGHAVSATQAFADEKGITIRTHRAERPIWGNADVTRLWQIFGNLLRNAIQYTPPGGEVHVGVVEEGAQAVFTFRDTGVGMTPEALRRTFTLFERGDVRGGEGMGVGLALVRHLVELHGGAVSAHSRGPGQGSEFQVRLPTCPAPLTQSTSDGAPAAAAGGRRVLLVDDNHNLRQTLRIALQQFGFSVCDVSDGARGIAELLSGQFDAAVVDLRMPDVDGCEVARRVREADLGRRLRLIALTGHAQADDRERAQQAGFDEVLLKPTDPEELARRLRA